MIIDGLVTLSGSYDWTGSAAANPENLNLLSSPRLPRSMRRSGTLGLRSRPSSIAAKIGVGAELEACSAAASAE